MAGMCLAKMCIFVFTCVVYPSKAWAPPAFLEGGGGGGGEHHLTAVNKLSAFGPFNQRVGVGGSAVYFWPIQSVRCEVSALSANPVIQSVGGGCCPLSMRMYVN